MGTTYETCSKNNIRNVTPWAFEASWCVVDNSGMIRWGIDLGGTKIEGVVLDGESTEPLARYRLPTEASSGYQHVLEQVEHLVVELESRSGLVRPNRIGMGTPGSIDPNTQLLRNCNATTLNGKPFQHDLCKTLTTDVVLANDANCFALAETMLGVAKGCSVIFGVILGTGVGGGVVVNGCVLNGANGIGGEWGHIPLESEGRPCYCGKSGCVETVLSGPSLESWYQSQCGRYRSLPEIALATDDPIAVATMDRLHSHFGIALAIIVNSLDPDAIVIGGGVGNIKSLYTLGYEQLDQNVFKPKGTPLRTKLLQPQLGDSAGVFGAAMLV